MPDGYKVIVYGEVMGPGPYTVWVSLWDYSGNGRPKRVGDPSCYCVQAVAVRGTGNARWAAAFTVPNFAEVMGRGGIRPKITVSGPGFWTQYNGDWSRDSAAEPLVATLISMIEKGRPASHKFVKLICNGGALDPTTKMIYGLTTTTNGGRSGPSQVETSRRRR